MNERRRISIAEPALVGNERQYVLDCLDSNWISSSGKYVEKFERGFADFCHAKHAVSCCNGTAALHATLLGLGLRTGDEVIVPALTYVATANAVTYCGATPVLAESESDTWNLDPERLESLLTARTRGVIAVHLFGLPAEMDAILDFARKKGLFVIEDAAEAHGAEYKGRRVGSLGDAAAFSFYGNKILTTGEGGMAVTDNDALAARLRLIRGQGMDPARRYWFPIIGCNYRLTNIQAAIGLAQLEKADWHMARRRAVAAAYRAILAGVPQVSLQSEASRARHAWWMTTVRLAAPWAAERDRIMADLAEDGIETRPVFYPLHLLPPYAGAAGRFPVAESIARAGISLPSHANLTQEDIAFVCDSLQRSIQRRSAGGTK